MIQQFISKEFFLFLLVGGTAACINWSSRIVYNHWVSFSTALLLAYVTGMTTAFVLNKLFVFKKSEQKLHQSAVYFTLVNIVALLQTWAVTLLLAQYAFPLLELHWHTRELAHAVGIIIPVFTSYLGHKHWSFRSSPNPASPS